MSSKIVLELQELTKALEEKSDDAQYFSQRAYAHLLLQNYNGKQHCSHLYVVIL